MSDFDITTSERRGLAVPGPAVWMRVHLRRAAMSNFVIAIASSTLALQLRFGGHITAEHAALSVASLWILVMVLWLRTSLPQLFSGVSGHLVRGRPRSPLAVRSGRYAQRVRRRLPVA